MRIQKFVFYGIAFFCLTCFLSLNKSSETDSETRIIKADLSVFETPMAKSLRKNVSQRRIKRMNNPQLQAVAEAMKDGDYSADYRLARYKAFLCPEILGSQLKIGQGYSKFENMTGIYLPKGRHIVLVDNIEEGKTVELIIPNWDRHPPEDIDPTKDPDGWGVARKNFNLHNGVNIIEVFEWDGLAYIDYYSENPELENIIEVHFVNAEVNGYFDIKYHNLDKWKELLDNAVYPVVDARGKHIQIAYPVKSLKKYAYNSGIELINNYDSLVFRQHRFIGLEKYNRVPENRILARVNYNYYMFRDRDGVAYKGTPPGYAMAMVVDPDRVISGDPCWGFSHEVGHVHQLRPYFNWGGMGEVSNNVLTLYVTTSFGNESRINEQNNYEQARESIIENNISYLHDPNVFNRLVPFWQLQLYFSTIGEQPDFYADLHEALRLQEPLPGETGENRGRDMVAEFQLNFVKQVCRVSQTDLTDFFEKWGFFWVGEHEIRDYGQFNYNMTQELVDACIEEIKSMSLPGPKVDLTLLKD